MLSFLGSAGGSSVVRGQRRRRGRTFFASALVCSSVISIGVMARDITGVLAAANEMDQDWIVDCDPQTGRLSVTPGFFNPLTDGQSAVLSLFQIVEGSPANFFSSGATVLDGVASVDLALLVNQAATFPDALTPWAFTINVAGNDYYRFSSVVTRISNGSRQCVSVPLTVLVGDNQRKSIGGAQVVAVPVQACGEFNQLVPLTPRPSGQYIATSALPEGFYRIGVIAPAGFATQWWDGKTCEATVPVVVGSNGVVSPKYLTSLLPEGRTIRVKLQDEDSALVNSACVTALSWSSGATSGNWIGSTCAPIDGVYTINGIGVTQAVTLDIRPDPSLNVRSQYFDSPHFSGTTGFTVESDGRFRSAVPPNAILPYDSVSNAVVVTLRSGGRFSGVVQRLVDGLPQAANGVCVTAIDQIGEYGRSTCTDSSGGYSFDVDAGGTYRVRFDGSRVGLGVEYYDDAGSWGSATPVSLSGGPSLSLDPVVLAEASSFQVDVSASSQPVNDACVSAWSDDGSGFFPIWVNGICGSDTGTYLLGGVQEGVDYKLSVDAPGFQTAWIGGSTRSTASIVKPPRALAVALTSGAGLSVSVQDASGTPIAACVGAFASGNPGEWGEFLGSDCSSTGAIEISGLLPGASVALRASSISGASAAAWIAGTAGNLTAVSLEDRATFIVPGSGVGALGGVQLGQAVRVSGSLTVNGTPTTGVCADVLATSPNNIFGTFLARGCSDQAGTYSVGGLPRDATVRIRFSVPGGSAAPVWYDGMMGSSDVAFATSVVLDADKAGIGANLSTISTLSQSESSVMVQVVEESTPPRLSVQSQQPFPPATPSPPSVEDAGGGGITASWPPVDSDGSPVRYVAFLFNAAGQIVAESVTSATSATFSGVRGPGSFSARVIAINGKGESPLSPTSSPLTLLGTAPGIPRQFEVTTDVAGAQFTWQIPEDAGGASLIRYALELSPGGGTCDTAEVSCSIEGLVPGGDYTASITAYSAYGRSSPTTTSFRFDTLSAPSAPRDVVVVPKDTRASISWSPPSSDGNSPISGYTVTAMPGGRSCSTTTALTCTVTKLTNGQSYSFYVVATNTIGSSPPGVSGEILLIVPPSAPTRLRIIGTGVNSLTFAWDPPTSNGGRPITGYEVRCSSDGGRTWIPDWTPVPGDRTPLSYQCAGLPRGTVITIQVRAVNDVGPGTSATLRSRTSSR